MGGTVYHYPSQIRKSNSVEAVHISPVLHQHCVIDLWNFVARAKLTVMEERLVVSTVCKHHKVLCPRIAGVPQLHVHRLVQLCTVGGLQVALRT